MHSSIGVVFVVLVFLALARKSAERNPRNSEPNPMPLTVELVREIIPRRGGRIPGESALPAMDAAATSSLVEQVQPVVPPKDAVAEVLERVAMDVKSYAIEMEGSTSIELNIAAPILVGESDPFADDIIIVDRHVNEWE